MFQSKSAKTMKTVPPCITQHKFDKKFKAVVSVRSDGRYIEILDWVNANSQGPVSVWMNNVHNGVIVDVAFTDPDDALFFKIKYSNNIEV